MGSVKINKVPYQYADIALALSDKSGEGLPASVGFTEIGWSDSVTREKLRGASRLPIDATEGEYDADGSITFHRYFYDAVIAWAKERGLGFYDIEFDATLSHRRRDGEPMNKTVIERVRFGSREFSGSTGPDPLTIACDLFIIGEVVENDVRPFAEENV